MSAEEAIEVACRAVEAGALDDEIRTFYGEALNARMARAGVPSDVDHRLGVFREFVERLTGVRVEKREAIEWIPLWEVAVRRSHEAGLRW